MICSQVRHGMRDLMVGEDVMSLQPLVQRVIHGGTM